jgi:hypothetical protein
MALEILEPDPAVTEAAWRVARINGPQYAALVAAELAPSMSEAMLYEALDLACASGLDNSAATNISALAPYLPATLFARAVSVAAHMDGEAARRDVFCALAPHVPAPLWSLVLTTASGTLPGAYLADVLIACAPHLPDAEAPALLRIAAGIQNQPVRVKALAGILPYLRTDLHRQVVAEVDAVNTEPYRLALIEGIAPSLSDVDLEEARQSAGRLADQTLREHAQWALDAAGRHSRGVETPTPSWSPLLSPALAAANRAEEIGSADTPRRRSSTLAAVPLMECDRDKVVTLRALAPHLTEADLPAALAAVRRIVVEDNRAEALIALLNCAPNSALSNIWSVIRDITDDALRLRCLELFGPRLAQADKCDRQALWSDILRTLAGTHRARLLDGVRVLAPVVGALGGDVVVQQAAVAIEDVCTWWP